MHEDPGLVVAEMEHRVRHGEERQRGNETGEGHPTTQHAVHPEVNLFASWPDAEAPRDSWRLTMPTDTFGHE